MRPKRLLQRVARGQVVNVAFDDFLRLAEALGFEHRRTTASHRIYKHPAIGEKLVLQPLRGQAKPYQVRQLIRLVEEYDLRLED